MNFQRITTLLKSDEFLVEKFVTSYLFKVMDEVD